MSYTKPYIDAAGLHIPSYVDIRDDLVARARQIFGEDVYLDPSDPDAQDYELISVFSDKIHDVCQLAQLIYNNRGPSTALGGGLDGVVKQNGIRRKPKTHSICPGILVKGDPGTQIVGGIVGDEENHLWDIGNVVIPESGEVEVTGTCRDDGPVYADIGTINRIITPTRGWISVVNTVNATPGKLIESDPALRARQAISTARPSRTVLQGTVGGIAEILDVTRYRVYENDTNVFGYYGVPIPGHSICAVVEGGGDDEIAREIYLRKTPGCGTYGDVEVEVQDVVSLSNTALEGIDASIEVPPIRFFRPRYVDVYVDIVIRALAGYVAPIGEQIRQNVCDYLNALAIGEYLTATALHVPVYSATPKIEAPAFSVLSLRIGKSMDNLDVEDMEILFNEVTRGNLANICITEV